MGESPSLDARTTVCELGRQMIETGLTAGTGGNVSRRIDDEQIAVSPTRMPYDEIEPADVPIVDVHGEVVAGEQPPSSETPLHTALYRARPKIGGVVHTHSTYANVFASLGEPIEPSHYQLAYVGREIPVAPFEQPGSEALAEGVVDTMGAEHDGCLLQNHGVVTVGSTAEEAFENAQMVEFSAKIHLLARMAGDPIVLEGADLEGLLDGFDAYRGTPAEH